MLKNFSEDLQQNRRSGFGSLQRKSWEPLMLTMKRSGDSTHLCRSPTTMVNGRDLTLPKRTQTSEQKYSDLAARNRRLSTAWTRNTPQSFSQGTRLYAFFLEVDKACEDVFSILPRFLKIFLESEMWSVVPRPGQKPHWVSFGFDSIISSRLFSRHLAT